jgi:hypothetical protein
MLNVKPKGFDRPLSRKCNEGRPSSVWGWRNQLTEDDIAPFTRAVDQPERTSDAGESESTMFGRKGQFPAPEGPRRANPPRVLPLRKANRAR